MKIYDCFQFFNEIDLLEIRLQNLYEVVDYFVIVESTHTHSGIEKMSYFLENKFVFEKYKDKIIHIIESFPLNFSNVLDFKKSSETNYNRAYNEILYLFDKDEKSLKQEPTFARDYLQREFIKLGLIECEDDDIILVSDLDEIPKREVIEKVRKENLLNKVLLMDCHNYYINNLSHTNWFGTFTIKYSDISDRSLSRLRGNSAEYFERISNSGWHLSFMGGIDRIKTKINNYAHQEFNNNATINFLSDRISNNTDVFGRHNDTYKNEIQDFYFESLKTIDIDSCDYPDDILNLIKDKFPYLIK